MPRRIAVAATAALLGCLGTAAPALAAGHPGEPPALSAHLRYDTTSWTADGTAMTVMAPRGWAFVLTPGGQARFNAPGRPDVLTMSDRADGSLRQQLRAKVAALQGTPALQVLETHVDGRGDTADGELRYRWTPPGGVPRVVHYRYQGDDVYEVAGPLADQLGLTAVLDTASATGQCS